MQRDFSRREHTWMDGLNAIGHTNLDDIVNVQVLSDRSFGGIQLKGLIGLVSVLSETVCRKAKWLLGDLPTIRKTRTLIFK